MASCSGNGSRGHHKFTLNVTETYVSGGADNYSTVSWSLVLSPIQTGWDWNYSSQVPVKYKVTINGTDHEGNIMTYDGKSTVTVASGTQNITHNSDGTKTANFSFSVWDNVTASYLPGSASGSGSITLTTIARYANFTQHYVKSSGLNSITIHYEVDSTITTVDYSLNGGNWVNTVGLPEYTIGNLSPNTTYRIKTRVKRADSGLYTTSGEVSGTTKDIAKISSAPNINFGDTARVVMTNPSGATKNLRVETLNPIVTIATRTNVGNDVTITFSDSEWDNLYKKLGNSSSITIRYVVDTQGNSTYYNYIDKTLTLKGNKKTIRNKVSGTWRRGCIWIKISGTWRRGVIWTKVSGTWRRGI